jgi:hypothetical protein
MWPKKSKHSNVGSDIDERGGRQTIQGKFERRNIEYV